LQPLCCPNFPRLAAAPPENSSVILEVPKLIFSALAAKTPNHSSIAAVFKRPEAKLVWEAAEKEVARIEAHDISWMAHSDPDFPIALNRCPDAPLVLFGSGQPFPNTTRVINIVGTRQPSADGKAFVRQLLESLAPYQPIIVSGFAYGIDIAAQVAAVENNLIAYGCLGHGILNCYPNKHLKHRKK